MGKPEKNIKLSGVKNIDLTGMRFGKLLVVERSGTTRYGSKTWRCLCDCGQYTNNPTTAKLRHGRAKTCGCGQARFRIKRAKGETPNFVDLICSYRYGAKRRGLKWDLTRSQAMIIFKQDCHYCGCSPGTIGDTTGYGPPFVYNGIDRKDSSIGYTIDNCTPCCKKCNYVKGSMDYDEFLNEFTDWIKATYNYLIQKDQ